MKNSTGKSNTILNSGLSRFLQGSLSGKSIFFFIRRFIQRIHNPNFELDRFLRERKAAGYLPCEQKTLFTQSNLGMKAIILFIILTFGSFASKAQIPVPIAFIIGPEQPCQTNWNFYATTYVDPGTDFVWTITPWTAGHITVNTGTAIEIDWNNDYSGEATINCSFYILFGLVHLGDSYPLTVLLSGPSSNFTTVSGSSNVCPGNLTEYTLNTSNMKTYSWFPPPGGSVTNYGNWANVTWDQSFSGPSVVIAAVTDNCDVLTAHTNDVTVVAPVGTPTNPVGPTSFICDYTPEGTYSTYATNANGYIWAVNPSSAGSVNGSGSEVNITWNPLFAGDAEVLVTAYNDCFAMQANTFVHITPMVGALDPIVGPANGCNNSSSQYSTSAANAIAYDWQLSPDSAGSIDGNNTYSSVTINWNPSFTGTADVSVSASNGCNSSAQVHRNVDVTAPAYWFADADGDGYGDSDNTLAACTQPSGYVSDTYDCDDSAATIHPGVFDIFNSIDDDCNGLVDEHPITATLTGGTSCADDTLTTGSSTTNIASIVWKRNGVVVNKQWDPNPIAVPFTNAVTAPNDISIDPYDSLLYVTDYGNHRILKRSLTDGSESIEVPVTQTQTVFVNPPNDIYVADDDGRSVRKYPWGGGGSYIVAGQQYTQGCDQFHLDFAVDVVEDANGYVVTLDRSCNHVERWNPGYGNGGDIIAGIGGYGSGLNQFNDPRALCFDNAGNLYVSDYGNHRVMKYAPGATEGVMVAGTGTAGNSRFELNHPRGIAVDADGDLFICDKENHRIQVWTEGATEGITIPISGLNDPVSIAFDLPGNMYIADFDGNKVIGTTRVTPAAPYLPVFTYAPTMNGSYTVEITDIYGYKGISDPVVINYIPHWYQDADGDGFGDVAKSTTQCDQPAGFVIDSTDCNDANYAANPSATEICNYTDDNCDGSVDELFDMDADGYFSCGGDCDDFDPGVNIGAFEICDGKDNDCDGIVDEGNDLDGDGFTTCDDCNDFDAAIYPGAADVCNSIDDNCDNVIDENAITATVTPAGTVSTCTGIPITLTANTGAGISYQWKKGNTNIAGATNSTYSTSKAGSYKVNESNSFGCSATSAITTVTVSSLPSATITPLGNLDICGTGSVVLQANSGVGYTYQWKKGANDIAGATNQTYTATKAATYKVTVTNSNNCSKISAGTKVTKSCKLDDEDGVALPELLSELHLYPNPTSGKFMIELSLPEQVNEATVHVINMLGQTVFAEKVKVTDGMLQKEIQLDNAVTWGSYMIRVITDDQVYSSQLIYQR